MTTNNGYATRESLSKHTGRRFTDVEIPNCGKFRLQSLNVREHNNFQATIAANTKRASVEQKIRDANFRLIQLCWVDGEGERVLEDEDPSFLDSLDSKYVTELWQACHAHTNVSENDIEDLVKNSSGTADS